MTTETYLAAWRDAGAITAAQEATLGALVRKERVSVSLELHSLLYLGVLAFVAGLGWTVHDHFANAGDVLVVASLAAIFTACVFYCLTHDPRAFVFDYVLYLGCLTFAVGLGYIEFRFHVLKAQWDAYLLLSALLYFLFAYRFDNRFVLSLALSSLAGWFGVRLSAWNVFEAPLRSLMILYGALVGAAGLTLHRARIRPHFLDAYLHVSANAVLVGLTSGAIAWNSTIGWTAATVVAAAASIAAGSWSGRFAFVVYGFLYGYVALSWRAVRQIHSETAMLAYFVLSGLVMIAALVLMARRSGRE